MHIAADRPGVALSVHDRLDGEQGLVGRALEGAAPAQFDDLLEEGHISVDHLIKRKEGRVSEKGPLFKLPKQHIPSLFLAAVRSYTL